MNNYLENIRLSMPVSKRDHIRGPENAPVTLLEYGDYQCPYCGEAYPVLREVQKRAGDKLRFVFRNFPLEESHPFAVQAAEAAEAAGAQGKFWEMHDMLYTHQDALDIDSLKQYAADLGLDTDRFNKDLESHAYEPRVSEDYLSGERSDVEGTPTFFLNGWLYSGDWENVDDILAAIDDSISS